MRAPGDRDVKRTPPGGIHPAATRQRLVSRADTVTTSVALPRPLHLRAVVAGTQLRWTLNEILRRALVEWLDRHAPAAPRTTARGRRAAQ